MKRRRTLIVSLLLVAALCMGIGYAAVSENLTISGKVSMAATEFEVVFSNAVEKTTTNDITSTIDSSSFNTTNLQFAVTGFQNAEDTETITVTVSNPHDFDVKLTDVVITQPTAQNNKGDAIFTVTAPTLEANPTVTAGSTTEFDVTITCNATSADAITENPFTITFKANTDLS